MDIHLSSSSLILKKCTCSKSTKFIKHIAKPGCSEDNNAVAILPDDWVPRHSGPILANYLKQRERDHNNIHDEIVKCAAVANDEIDKKILTLAQNLLAHINQNENEIDCVVEKCHVNKGLTEQARDDALKKVHELSLERLNDVAFFKRDATAIERERAENLKIILREKFQCLVAVGHMNPKELLHDFDGRIYDINHQLLSNSRAFTELEAQLRVFLDGSVVNARSSLNQLTLGIGVVYRGRNSHSALRHSIEENLSQRPPGTGKAPEPFIGQSLLGDVEKVDTWVGRLVQAYRSAVLTVYTGFYSNLELLQNDLYSQDLINRNIFNALESPDFQTLLERPLVHLSNFKKEESVNTSLLDLTAAEVKSMQKSLSSLGECLRDTYLILHYAGHLLDAHLLRSALAQTLTIAAVEDLLTSHDTMEYASEIPISIALEQLRCSSDVEKLNQQYDIITHLLKQTADMYLQHSEAEVGRLEEFMKLSPVMISTLLSEFALFLEKYPRSKPASNTEATIHTPIRNISMLRLPLPRAILQTELQELALKNWKNGFLESFEGNISLVPEELKHQAQLWIEERSTSLHMRYSLKMISHDIRIERIKAAREVRLAELRYHESRLESHLLAVYKLVELLPLEASEFAAIDSPCLYPFVTWVERAQISINEALDKSSIDPETVQLKMASYALRLPKYRNYFEESLDKAIGEHKMHIEQRVQEARISNLRFLTHIKLFSEGGRYAAQEALKTCAALTKASEALELCVPKALDALKNRRAQLLAYADSNYILPLMRIVDGNTKISTKSNTRMDKGAKKKK